MKVGRQLRRLGDVARSREAFVILCVQVAVLHVGQSLIVPILPLYTRAFGVDATLVGLLLATQGIPRVFANVPAGKLADRLGAHRLLALSAGVVAVSAVGGALAPSYLVLLLTRVLQGIGSAISHTAGLTYTANVSSAENRARHISVYQGSFLLGNGVGPVFGGLTAQVLGYRAPFVGYALIATVVGVWVVRRLPDPRDHAPAVGGDPRGASEDTGTRRRRGITRASIGKAVLLACVLGLVASYTRSGSRDFAMVLLGQDLGIGEGGIGAVLSLVFIANVAVLYLAGTLTDRHGVKRMIVVSWIFTAAGLLLLSAADSYVWMLAAAGIYGIAAGAGNPVPAVYIANVVDRARLGSALGLYRTFNDIGLITGPLVMGWVAERSGPRIGLAFNAAVVVAATAIFVLFHRERVPRSNDAPLEESNRPNDREDHHDNG